MTATGTIFRPASCASSSATAHDRVRHPHKAHDTVARPSKSQTSASHTTPHAFHSARVGHEFPVLGLQRAPQGRLRRSRTVVLRRLTGAYHRPRIRARHAIVGYRLRIAAAASAAGGSAAMPSQGDRPQGGLIRLFEAPGKVNAPLSRWFERVCRVGPNRRCRDRRPSYANAMSNEPIYAGKRLYCVRPKRLPCLPGVGKPRLSNGYWYVGRPGTSAACDGLAATLPTPTAPRERTPPTPLFRAPTQACRSPTSSSRPPSPEIAPRTPNSRREHGM